MCPKTFLNTSWIAMHTTVCHFKKGKFEACSTKFGRRHPTLPNEEIRQIVRADHKRVVSAIRSDTTHTQIFRLGIRNIIIFLFSL